MLTTFKNVSVASVRFERMFYSLWDGCDYIYESNACTRLFIALSKQYWLYSFSWYSSNQSTGWWVHRINMKALKWYLAPQGTQFYLYCVLIDGHSQACKKLATKRQIVMHCIKKSSQFDCILYTVHRKNYLFFIRMSLPTVESQWLVIVP